MTRRSCARRRPRGFTLLELIVTLGVAAVLVTVGVPSFLSFVQNNRATTHTNDLVTALNLARSEAMQRGTPVTVCSSTNGTTCSGATDWSNGWVVLAPGPTLLRTWPKRSGGTGVLTGNAAQVQFQPRGSVTAANTVFNVRVPDCTGNQGRDVTIGIAGRISVGRAGC
jgi:type IV fimbrial biogenesis protein FimT